ncbi:MAG TPA: ribulose-phosphate 3-epimerase [Acidimicrobiia bacterium]|nr:ribulose-phosphate 3-epimerase [Acidimicrobiia bacterium]
MPTALERTPTISPSILSADFAYLADSVAKVRSETNRIHVDCMDGHFVNNLTIGPPVVKSLRPHTDAYLDCHLMCTKPEVLIDAFVDAGADAITVHVELDNVSEILDRIADAGVDVGLTFNPDTPFSAVEPFMDRLNILLFMSVFPGFGGQKFIPEVLDKVAQAIEYRQEHSSDIIFTIDGGINKETIASAARAGCDVLVAGSAVFHSPDPAVAVRELQEIADSAFAESV